MRKKKMYLSVLIITTNLFVSAAAFAQIVKSGLIEIRSQVPFVEMKVRATCRPPQFEDDTFTVFFSADSFKAVKKYTQQGYKYQLIAKSCVGSNAINELPSDAYEDANIILFNPSEAQKKLDDEVKELLNKYK